MTQKFLNYLHRNRYPKDGVTGRIARVILKIGGDNPPNPALFRTPQLLTIFREGDFSMEFFVSEEDAVRYMDLALEVPSVLAQKALERVEKEELTPAQLKRLVRESARSVLQIDNMWRIVSRKTLAK